MVSIKLKVEFELGSSGL